MHTRREFVDDYEAAMKAEAELWQKIRGHGPGQPGFDDRLWTQWLEAVSRTTKASKALRDAFRELPRD